MPLAKRPDDPFDRELRSSALAVIQRELPAIIREARNNTEVRALRKRAYIRRYMKTYRLRRAAEGRPLP